MNDNELIYVPIFPAPSEAATVPPRRSHFELAMPTISVLRSRQQPNVNVKLHTLALHLCRRRRRRTVSIGHGILVFGPNEAAMLLHMRKLLDFLRRTARIFNAFSSFFGSTSLIAQKIDLKEEKYKTNQQ
ncbi:hypothetical protein niasHS_006498 [Heterodera schachtii]|uniref:Uncharacterized protein n=1 Tax=Heterodera schachtii TaxID=97005 RepID=A0ABD2JHG8_HETSC